VTAQVQTMGYSLAHAIGVVGAVFFYGRFYVQWLASERRKQSVIPVAFWYLSSAGSLMLLTWGVVSQSPLGALGQCLNIVIYARNLVHIWRERGRITPRANRVVNLAVVLITVVSVLLAAWTWYREWQTPKAEAEQAVQVAWIWLGVGLAGQLLFACRFIIQWVATERKGRSVVPPVFWHLSVAASVLMGLAFVQRREWVFAAGMAATLLIYLRNLWLIHVAPGRPAETA